MFRLGLRSAYGHRVMKATMDNILKNPFYTGSFRWAGEIYAGSHGPLVGKELFDAANDVLSGRGHRTKPRAHGYAFSNIAQCGLCGCRIIGERKKGKYVYYHCTFSKGRHTGVRYHREIAFASMFDDVVRQVTLEDDSRDWLAEMLNGYLSQHTEYLAQRASALLEDQKKQSKRLDRLYDTLCDGVIGQEAFATKEKQYRAELTRIECELSSSRRGEATELQNGLDILELANHLHDHYVSLNLENRAKMLRILASNYYVHGATVNATYRKPFKFFADLSPRVIKLPRLDSN